MVKNYVTHAIQLKLHERMNKQQIVTSYGENKNLNEEIKKTEQDKSWRTIQKIFID